VSPGLYQIDEIFDEYDKAKDIFDDNKDDDKDK